MIQISVTYYFVSVSLRFLTCSFFFPRHMTNCVTAPETPMTTNVLTMVMRAYSHTDDFTAPHDSIRPAAAGMNIIGMTAIRKELTSLMSLTFTHLFPQSVSAASHHKAARFVVIDAVVPNRRHDLCPVHQTCSFKTAAAHRNIVPDSVE